MNEECINISECICQRRLMRRLSLFFSLLLLLFFSFCNIKIAALINSPLKPPSAALSAHAAEREGERDTYSLLSPSLRGVGGGWCGEWGGDSERQTDKKRMHPFFRLSLPSFHSARERACMRIYGGARRAASRGALKSAATLFTRRLLSGCSARRHTRWTRRWNPS